MRNPILPPYALNHSRHSQPGSSLVDYCIIGALILVASLGALMVLGSNLHGTLAGIKHDFHQNVSAAETAEQNSPGNGSSYGIGGVIPPPGPDETQYCLPSNWCVNVPNNENFVLTDTAGGLGGDKTQEMALVIKQIAKQLAQDPDADQTLVQLITDLANQGHQLGDRENDAYDFCPIGESCPRANGVHAEMRDMLMQLHHQKRQTSEAQRQVMEYLESHPGSLPPEMQNIIAFEADQINKIANAFPNPHLEDGNMTGDVDLNGDYFSWDFEKPVALTHQKSDTICGNGGHQHQCTRNN